MNLHEYQTKDRFSQFDIPVAFGQVAASADEAAKIAAEIGGRVVIKAQVLTGGRGKAGGVKLANSPEEAREVANTILGMNIKGHIVQKVLVDPAATIQSEIYLGITNDRTVGKPLLMASSEGGVEIEQVARDNPNAIMREWISPSLGLRDYQARNVANGMNLPREHWNTFTRIAQSLYRCYIASDAVLAEINPLIINGDNQLVALDGKMVIDDNALYRQKDLEDMRDTSAEPRVQVEAREAGLTYVKLDGQIGCMVNGAGLAMTTMDMIKLYGGGDIGPANFLDIGGGAQADRVAAALRIILSDPDVKAVLLNIFGGITRGDEVARGILQALEEVPSNIPMVIRLAGTNAEEGLAIIDTASIPNIQSAATLTAGAQKAIAAARGA